MAYVLTRKALILDLYAAFECARQHKSNRPYVRHFARNLRRNIERLADDLLSHTYKPEPSTVFIVERPKSGRSLPLSSVTEWYITSTITILTPSLRGHSLRTPIAVFPDAALTTELIVLTPISEKRAVTTAITVMQ